ncbi:MAG TPA: hypothetical protein VIF57_10695 [Polyangia bacterium]
MLLAGACTLARAEDDEVTAATAAPATAAPAAPAAPAAAPVATPAPAARAVTLLPAASAPSQNPPPLSVAGLSVLADGAAKKQSLNFQMGDAIHVKLAPGNLARLQAAAAERRTKLGLSLNGHFLADVQALVIGADELVFVPSRNDASKAFWDELWGGRLLTPQTLTVAIGLEDASTFVTSETNLLMEPLQGAKAFSLIAGGVLLLILMIALVVMTPLVRDGARLPGGKLPTYSLARTQMAFWFVNVVLAVLIIWAVTGSVPPITSSVLGLMGIGTGTALGAVLLDQHANAAENPAKESVSFFRDVLTDGATIGLHRFQMLVWTVVVFFVFWGAVWNKLALPEFDNTLLALMGISAGAYLGFKFPENLATPR